MSLLRERKPVPAPVLEHLKMFKLEREQQQQQHQQQQVARQQQQRPQKISAEQRQQMRLEKQQLRAQQQQLKQQQQQLQQQKRAAAQLERQRAQAALAEKRQADQIRRLELERQRLEQQRQEAIARAERERLAAIEAARLAEEERLRQEELARQREAERVERARLFEIARVKQVGHSRVLLRRLVEAQGYDAAWVSDAMLEEACQGAMPAAEGDSHAEDLRLAAESCAALGETERLERQLAREKAEREQMAAEDVNANAGGEADRGRARNEAAMLDYEFEEFFKYRSAKTVASNDWDTSGKKGSGGNGNGNDPAGENAATNGEGAGAGAGGMTAADKAVNNEVKKRQRGQARALAAAAASTQQRRPRRQVKSRLVNVEGHMVLKANNYSMEEGHANAAMVPGAKPTDLRAKVKAARPAYTIFASEQSKLLKQADPGLQIRDVQKVSAGWAMDPAGPGRLLVWWDGWRAGLVVGGQWFGWAEELGCGSNSGARSLAGVVALRSRPIPPTLARMPSAPGTGTKLFAMLNTLLTNPFRNVIYDQTTN